MVLRLGAVKERGSYERTGPTPCSRIGNCSSPINILALLVVSKCNDYRVLDLYSLILEERAKATIGSVDTNVYTGPNLKRDPGPHVRSARQFN